MCTGSILLGGRFDNGPEQVMAVTISTDNGSTWNCSELTSAYGNVRALAVDPDDPGIILAGGHYQPDRYYMSGLFRSTNGGIDWEEIGSSLTGNVESICIDPFDHHRIYVGTLDRFYISTDRGSTWSGPDETKSVMAITADPTTENRLFIGTAYNGVYLSRDGGMSWDPLNDGLTSLVINCLDFDPVTGMLYAGTQGGGVFRYDVFTAVQEEHPESRSPHRPTLQQNHPNPFNARTAIAFELQRTSSVEMTIFDSRGRVIMEWSDREYSPGRHAIVWDGTDSSGRALTSGIYICRLKIENLILTRKMVLQR